MMNKIRSTTQNPESQFGPRDRRNSLSQLADKVLAPLTAAQEVEQRERAIDEMLRESFPASDAPQWGCLGQRCTGSTHA